MTSKHTAEIIATKVHGWKQPSPVGDHLYSAYFKDGVSTGYSPNESKLHEHFDPENNDTQAREALEAWCKGEGSRDVNLEFDGEWWYVLLNEDEEDKHHNWYPKCKADVNKKSLSAAIVEALCSAVVTKEQLGD